MRLGCLGVLIVALVLGSLLAGALWTCVAVIREPNLIPVSPMRADPSAVGRLLAEVRLREGNRSDRGRSIAFSEAEAAAYLAQSLGEAGIHFSRISVSFRNARMTTQGQLPLQALLQGPPFERVSGVIPRRILYEPVWITLTATLKLDSAQGPARSRYGDAMLLETEDRPPIRAGVAPDAHAPRTGTIFAALAGARHRGAVDIGDGRLTIRTR